MKRILPLILTLFSLIARSQTTPLTFTNAGTTEIQAPGRGAEFWNGVQWTNTAGGGVKIPAGNSTVLSYNWYNRYNWKDIESDVSQGVYNWTAFDNSVHSAMNAHQMYSFGLMPICDGCGAGGHIPTYLHNLMQGEATKDWFYSGNGGYWVPNWNSPSFINRYIALMQAVANHIAISSFKPTWSAVAIPYSSVIYQVDIRGYGDYGEWHLSPWWENGFPSNLNPTSATLHTLIDANLAAFPNFPNMALIGGFFSGASSFVPADVSYYLLTVSNNWGKVGWRRDNYGDDGYASHLENNTETFNPGSGNVALDTLIMNKYLHAPVGGEPLNGLTATDNSGGQRATAKCGSPYCDLPIEINNYHASSFGNGNYADASLASTQTNAITASFNAGYRVVLEGGSMTTSPSSGGSFNITLNYHNLGLSPPYESYNASYELRTSTGTVVWSSPSSFQPKFFQPSGSATVLSENFVLPAIAAGTYSLFLIMRDPLSYKQPFTLFITGRQPDGSYLIRSNITVTAGGTVTANAGPDQTITAPTSSVTLNGNASSGPITTYLWSQLSGPNTATLTTPSASTTGATGLIAGTYTFQLSLNSGAATDQVVITVNPAPPPVANAGPDQTIIAPASSVNLTGAASTGTITSYAWTELSGPNSATLTTPSSVTTSATGLIPGTYTFRLSLNGGTATDNVVITVSPPPVANAGADQAITLPTSAVTLNASGSSGTITSYLWTTVSGPNTPTITTPTTASTTVTGLVAGTYVFQLSLNGGVSTDQMTVVVNNTPPPVANAGPDQAITLPTSSVNLTAAASTGTITSYSWTRISGPNVPTITTPTTVTTSVTGLIAGVYVFQVSLNGGSSVDQVQVTVNPANPIANAGVDLTITLPTSQVTVNASGSTGVITSYSWTQISGPVTANILNPTASTTTITGLTTAGVYTFQLALNGGSTDQMTVTVNPANPVIANAGNDQTITVPTSSVTVNGSSSLGTITSYLWTQISGPNTANIVSPAAVSTTINGLVQGSYTFRLSVNGGVSTDDINIIVNGVVPVNGVLPNRLHSRVKN